MKPDYIQWLRSKVGHEKVILMVALALIIDDKGRVLMQQRADSKLWGFVGGMMELGESFEETLKREVFEETGIAQLEILDQLGVFNCQDFTYPNGDRAQNIELVYVVKSVDEIDLTYKDEETLSLRFVDLAAMDTDIVLFNDYHKAVIEKYLDWRTSNEII
jgi:8-oxo-dGTP pyrophosphatase MutT (NUDIX family)